VARRVSAGSTSRLEPEVTGGFRPGDVRHVVASPDLARRELGFTAAVDPATGLADFATAPLRA
jgi:dTDP-L-rhamnose 4-epimerase